MKYTFPVILILLLCSSLLFNCDCKHLCSSPTPVLKFVPFDSAALSVVIVKQYNNNGQFNDLEHTQIFSSTNFSAMHTSGSDTSEIDSAGISLDYISDYIIELPASGKTWYLKSISMQATKMNEQHCTNGIRYVLNDTLHVIQPDPASSYDPAAIYLNR